MRPDEVDRVAILVQCQLGGLVHDLRLSQRGNGLVLKGYAHTCYARQLAQHAVMEAADIQLLANEIEVA